MRKLLIDVYLPVALKSYDIQIPADMKLADATRLVADALSQLSGGSYTADSGAILCDRESGKILNINMTVWELGLRNGSRLMLI